MKTGPLSRRTANLALGGGLLSLWLQPWQALAQARALPSFSFLVITDTHLGRQDSPTAARQWTKTAQELAKADGAFVLHLGDVVDGGREPQYAVYKEIRQQIGKPVHEIPGNHDPQELFEKHLRKPVDFAFDHQGVRFLLFNNSHTDSHDGFITTQQLTWLGDQCAEAVKKDLLLLFCCHVPVHTNKPPDRAWYVKPKDGQTDLYQLLDKHKDRVLALFHGHFHNGVRGWDDRAPLQEMCFPSALYNQDRKLADAQAPGYYLAEMRPGFVQVTLGKGQLQLRYRPVGVAETAEKAFAMPQLK